MKRLAASALVLGAFFATWGGARAAPVFEEQVLLTSGEGGFHTYRIPAAICTGQGTVLFFCEARKTSSSDFAETHLLLLRSTDDGRTWSDPQIVWKDTSEPNVTIGNPCPVYDAETQTVWIGFTRNNQRAFVTKSADDGVTWAAPREITDAVRPESWRRYWTGPGHGLQLTEGPKAGRLIFPSYHIVDEGDRRVMRSHVVYSDDHGETWQIGQSTAIGPEIDPEGVHLSASWVPGPYDWEGCECLAAERSDGRLYLTVRNQARCEGKKGRALSDDGGESWSPLGLQDDLAGAGCQSSVLRLPDGEQGKDRILWSGIPGAAITGGLGHRRHLTVFLSEDGGESFPLSRLVHAGPSAYSDMTLLPDRTVLLFYEGGAKHRYAGIRVARFNLDWLMQPNRLVNGDFEKTAGWGEAGSAAFPPGWGPGGGDRTNAAVAQSGEHAIGGSGTSALLPAHPAAERSNQRDLAQGFTSIGPKWRFEMDFAAEEPDGQGSEHRTLSLGWRTGDGIGFYLIVTGNGKEGASADGLGDVQIHDPGSGYFTPPGLADAVTFDPDVQTTPQVHHLCVEGDFTAAEPYFDVHVTDFRGSVHSATGLKLFSGGTPNAGSALARFADNTFLSTGDHLIDNVSVSSAPNRAAAEE